MTAYKEFSKHPLSMTFDWLEKLLFIGKRKLKRAEDSCSVATIMLLVYCEQEATQVTSADEQNLHIK